MSQKESRQGREPSGFFQRLASYSHSYEPVTAKNMSGNHRLVERCRRGRNCTSVEATRTYNSSLDMSSRSWNRAFTWGVERPHSHTRNRCEGSANENTRRSFWTTELLTFKAKGKGKITIASAFRPFPFSLLFLHAHSSPLLSLSFTLLYVELCLFLSINLFSHFLSMTDWVSVKNISLFSYYTFNFSPVSA